MDGSRPWLETDRISVQEWRRAYYRMDFKKKYYALGHSLAILYENKPGKLNEYVTNLVALFAYYHQSESSKRKSSHFKSKDVNRKASLETKLTSILPKKFLRRVSSQSVLPPSGSSSSSVQHSPDLTPLTPLSPQMPIPPLQLSQPQLLQHQQFPPSVQNVGLGLQTSATSLNGSVDWPTDPYQQHPHRISPSISTTNSSVSNDSFNVSIMSGQASPLTPISSPPTPSGVPGRVRSLTVWENVGMTRKNISGLPKTITKDSQAMAFLNKMPTLAEDELPFVPDPYQSILALLDVLSLIYQDLVETSRDTDQLEFHTTFYASIIELEDLFRKMILNGEALLSIDAIRHDNAKREPQKLDELLIRTVKLHRNASMALAATRK